MGRGSFYAFSGKTRTSKAANYTSYSVGFYSGTTLETLLWCFGIRVFRRWCEMVSDQAVRYQRVTDGTRTRALRSHNPPTSVSRCCRMLQNRHRMA